MHLNAFIFYTSSPSNGKKMRCFGSTNEFTVGVVFALPQANTDATSSSIKSSYLDPAVEDEALETSKTYSWPSGYSAKTEFNIDERGNLINGRGKEVVTLNQLRKMNHNYLYDKDHILACGRVVKGGLKVVPYNEVFLKVGGGKSISSSTSVSAMKERSYDKGVGLPVAIFVRTAEYGNLVSLLRTRARILSILGKKGRGPSGTVDSTGSHTDTDRKCRGPFIDDNIPLLMITPDGGAKVLTQSMQTQLLHNLASNLNPFQNPMISYKTEIGMTDEKAMQQKMEELIDLEAHEIKNKLTAEERARLAGGFGATDDSVAALLLSVMEQDNLENVEHGKDGKLQDIVNEGLSNAVRAGDYHTSRQLLILYTLVASKGRKVTTGKENDATNDNNNPVGYESDNSDSFTPAQLHTVEPNLSPERCVTPPPSSQEINLVAPTPLHSPKDPKITTIGKPSSKDVSDLERLAPPPPPPLDTDRLRSATNSDGLLAVLGAAEVLKSMENGSAKTRVMEAVAAMEE